MSTAANTGVAAFAQSLVSEAESVGEFVRLLKLEQAALASGDTAKLPAMAEEKANLAAALNAFAERRNAALAAQGFAPDRIGVEAWCAKHGTNKNAAPAWAKILQFAGEARELNRVNGELIKMRMQYNASALEALRGGNSAFDLYGPDGQATSSGNRRINDAV